MAALAWAAFVPASLYVTRAIGNSVTQTVLRRQPPQAPDTTIDTDAVLSTADIAVNMKTFTKTAAQLQRFVSQSANRLRRLIQKTKERQEKHSWSRIFRDPDFSEENKATRNEVDTLKSRIELFFSVLTLMPHHARFKFFKKSITEKDECPDSSEESSEEEAGTEDSSTPPKSFSEPFSLSDIFPNMFAFEDPHVDLHVDPHED